MQKKSAALFLILAIHSKQQIVCLIKLLSLNWSLIFSDKASKRIFSSKTVKLTAEFNSEFMLSDECFPVIQIGRALMIFWTCSLQQ